MMTDTLLVVLAFIFAVGCGMVTYALLTDWVERYG